MPRNGDGSSDNGPFEEADHNIAHGVGKADVSFICPSYHDVNIQLTIVSV